MSSGFAGVLLLVRANYVHVAEYCWWLCQRSPKSGLEEPSRAGDVEVKSSGRTSLLGTPIPFRRRCNPTVSCVSWVAVEPYLASTGIGEL